MSDAAKILQELEPRLANVMQVDRFRLRRQWREIQQAIAQGRDVSHRLPKYAEQVRKSCELRTRRAAGRPAMRAQTDLPILEYKTEIAAAIERHQVVIVCGETGSGKSTQLPQICLEMGRGISAFIGHTQPRRIAARTIASRLAQELGTTIGQAVGFKVRFTDATRPETYIKLMTDGILLAETQHDRFLDQYDTIILDEAHERSLNIDFLLGYLKRLLPRRPDLKLIITSATINAERFREHFSRAGDDVPVITIPGRTYPIETIYRPPVGEEGSEPDWLEGVLDAVDELSTYGSGDMLIFLPTERDIHTTAKALRGRMLSGPAADRNTEILPLYARLSDKDQQRVFSVQGRRKIVLATNVAESSLTVPNIRYVIDTGTARISRYSARSRTQRLPIEAISKASADQRAGRCGRVGPGVCLRMYSAEDYLSRDAETPPEIQRTNLAHVILQTLALGLGTIEEFPFLDPPKAGTIQDGYNTLFELGAVDENRNLTKLGKELSRLPVDPRIGRMLLASRDEHCLTEMLIIASAMEVADPRDRPVDKQQAADEKHAQWAHEDSDFLSYLKLWDFYHQLREKLSANQLRKACLQNFLSWMRMREWVDVHQQLLQLLDELGVKPTPRRDDYASIHRALLTGLLSGIALKGDDFEYTAAGGGQFRLWPGSSLFGKKPEWIVAGEMVETQRRYLRTVARIQPEWIEPLAGHLLKRSYSEPQWDRKRGCTIANEKVNLFGLTIVPRRAVRYTPIDAVVSREIFIRSGLLPVEVDFTAGFLEHNQQLLDELQQEQAKTRQFDYWLGDEARYQFYDERIPSDVSDVPTLNRWRKEAERENPRVLFMSKQDLLPEGADDVAAQNFPDELRISQMKLPLDYHLEPGAEEDGVTLTVPREALAQLDSRRLGWLVPGLLEEKIAALLRTLPKESRRMFVPVNESAKQIISKLRFGEGDLLDQLSRTIREHFGEHVPTELFDEQKLPRHLRMNVKVIDEKGKVQTVGRDVEDMRRQLGGTQNPQAPTTMHVPEWEQDGITTWEWDQLPAQVRLERGGLVWTGFPSLIDRGTTVSLRLADSLNQAERQTRVAIRRLFVLAHQRPIKTQIQWIPKLDKISLLATGITGFSLREQLADLLVDRALFGDEKSEQNKIPRTKGEFDRRMKEGSQQLSLVVQEIAPWLLPIFEGYRQTRQLLDRKPLPAYLYSVDDMREQLNLLMVPDFLTSTPWVWLTQYPRYFSAIRYRWEKLTAGGLERDRRGFAEIVPRLTLYRQQRTRLDQQGGYDVRLEYYRWMLEEFRVSLFAQPLGVAIPVSAKRLDEQWSRVGRP
ncbi:MAG: ATP-dependent RNA helicase HrpA [Planctomycetaceae bacterium]